jgi:hypothetical protein
MKIRKRVRRLVTVDIGIAIVLLFGVIFIVIGVVIGVVNPREMYAEIARIEQLDAVSAAGLADRTPGSALLIEGVVSDRNKVVFRDMVAYASQEYHGEDDDGDQVWADDVFDTPPLRIDLPDGAVQIANADYALTSLPFSYQDSEKLSWSLFRGEGTKRYQALRHGDAVLSIGTVVIGNEGAALQAEQIAIGTRSSYLASQRDSAASMPWAGIPFGVFGIIMLGFAVWMMRN